MENIIIPEELKGKELFRFLRANKSILVNQKKSVTKFTDAVCFPTWIFHPEKREAVKAAKDTVSPDTGVLNVKVVANTSLWIDSDMDLLLRDNATKSIKERKGLIKHLKDHGRTLQDEVGDVNEIYYQDIPLKELGYNKSGTGQALIFDTDIKKSYDAATYEKYRIGKINQHSIGLRYVRMDLAINDDEDEKEKDFWDKYYPMIINPEAVDDKGYFWVIPEIKLIENSCVLFGSNILTPVLQSSATESAPGKSTHAQPESTEDEPPTGTQKQPLEDEIDWDQVIKEIKFFN